MSSNPVTGLTDYTAPHKGMDLLALSHAERIFLWCIRVWSASHRDPTLLWSCLERVFAHEGMLCALTPFNGFMKAVFAGLSEPADIRCLHAGQIGEHEARLLTTLAHLQNNHAMAARQTLKGWLNPSSLRSIVFHGAACAVGAKAANVRFSRPVALPQEPIIKHGSRTARVVSLH